jgi:hypothetical protein
MTGGDRRHKSALSRRQRVSALIAYAVDPCVGGSTVDTVTLGN